MYNKHTHSLEFIVSSGSAFWCDPSYSVYLRPGYPKKRRDYATQLSHKNAVYVSIRSSLIPDFHMKRKSRNEKRLKANITVSVSQQSCKVKKIFSTPGPHVNVHCARYQTFCSFFLKKNNVYRKRRKVEKRRRKKILCPDIVWGTC